MINKKAGFLLRDWVIALLVMNAIIVLWYLASADLASDYNREEVIDPTFRTKYDSFTNTTDDVSGMYDEATSEEGLSVLGAVTGVFRAVWGVVELTFGGLSTIEAQTASFASDYGVPETVSNVIFKLAIAIVVVMIVFVVISSINRGNKL